MKEERQSRTKRWGVGGDEQRRGEDQLTVCQEHGLVCGVEAAVGHPFVCYEHHGHLGPRGGQVRREAGSTEPEVRWLANQQKGLRKQTKSVRLEPNRSYVKLGQMD